MKVSTRIRIIIFALMIFGAFANFALNEWGLTIITYCELAITFSFISDVLIVYFEKVKKLERIRFSQLQLTLGIVFILLNIVFVSFSKMPEMMGIFFFLIWGLFALSIVSEAIYDLIKKQDNHNNYEHFVLAMFFYGLYFRNMAFPGAAALMILCVLLLVPYYFTTTIQFFKLNFKSGKTLVAVLAIGSICTIFLGITFLAKTLHWPQGFINIVFYSACFLCLFMLASLIKWNFLFKEEKINIFQGLKLFQNQIILLFYISSLFLGYKYLVAKKIAPDFRSQALPAAIYKIRESGITTDEKILEHENLMRAYNNFVEQAKKNGFVK